MDGRSVASQRISHLGKILFNLSLVGALLCLASLASFLLVALYYIALIIILLGTVFLILIYYPEFTDLFTGGERILETVTAVSAQVIPVVAPLTAVLAALSIAALAVSKRKGQVARIVFAAIFFAVGLAFAVFGKTAIGGGQ